jgi:Flp pilus assembly protein TadG
MKRLKFARRGQAVVEFALVLPLVLIMVISVFEFARAWNIQQVLTDAAREGARVAVVGAGNEEAEGPLKAKVAAKIDDALSVAGIDPSKATYAMPGVGDGHDQPATVQITLPHRFLFLGPLMEWTLDKSSLTLRTSITMRNE